MIKRFLHAFDRNQLPLWWPGIRGILLGRAEWQVIKARIQVWLTGRVTPFMTKDGCRITTPLGLLCWWEHRVMGWLFDGIEWPADVKRVLDIGASEGVWGWEVKRLYPKAVLIGYEPNYEDYKRAEAKGIYTRLHFAALGRRDGQAPLFTTGLTHSTDTLYSDGHSAEVVPMERLDSRYAKEPFDVVKIDVDGAELDVVLGGLKTLIASKLVLVEISRPEHVRAIGTLLQRQPVHLGNLDYAFVK